MGAMLPFPNKRPREEELEDDRIDKGRKKPRPLPLRTAPLSSHSNRWPQNDHLTAFRADPSTLTPTESSEDDDESREHTKPGTPPLTANKECLYSMRLQAGSDADSDLEMTDCPPKSSSTFSPWSAGLRSDVSMSSPIPSQLVNQNLNVSGGRTATPIYSHFTSNMNVDAMMRDAASPALLSPWQSTSGPVPTPSCQDMWRNRRLPTPISEDEKCASPGLPQTLNLKFPTNCERSTGHARLRNSKLANNVQTMEHDASNEYQHAQHDVKASPGAHARPNRLKMGIAMGFRADCDKCQRRIPGHYSHIVRT